MTKILIIAAIVVILSLIPAKNTPNRHKSYSRSSRKPKTLPWLDAKRKKKRY